MDYVSSFAAPTYPRVLQAATFNKPFVYASILVACIASFVVLVTGLHVYRKRKRHVMVVAQTEFLCSLLAGLLALWWMSWWPPTDISFDLLPLVAKVGAINRLMSAALHMRGVQLSRQSLFGAVMLLMVMTVLLFTVWTILDPPRRQVNYCFTDFTTESDETISNRHLLSPVRFRRPVAIEFRMARRVALWRVRDRHFNHVTCNTSPTSRTPFPG